ncbi:MAG: hypothetical protein Fur0022_03970 [Anaerolineales bacterium]
MNIRLGIYEIFARIVPGGFYLVALVQTGIVLGLITLDLNAINQIGLLPSLGLAFVAYLLGTVFDILSPNWHRLFKPKNFSAYELQDFKSKYPDWTIEFEDKDWPVLLAYIRRQNLELGSEIDKYNAQAIMLRNVSLGLMWIAGNEVIYAIIQQNAWHLLIAFLLILVSLMVIRRATTFRQWYYSTIFQIIFSYRINLEDSIHKNPPKKEKKETKTPDT